MSIEGKQRVILVDIECEGEVLKRFKEKHGKQREASEMADYPIKDNFCATQQKMIEAILLENAVAAMQAIVNSGEDVWIVISTSAGERAAVTDQMKWVESKFSPYWSERIIVSRDKTILNGDILIDPQPNPEKETVRLFTPRKQETKNPPSRKPTWEHVLFDKPCNVNITDKRRLVDWKNWKSILHPEVDESVSYPYFIHGSKDSLDEDRLYLFPEMPSAKEIRQFLSGVTEDRNIFVVSEGRITHVHKGFPDEVQNALFTTYSFHKQEHPLPFTEKVPRLVISKVVGAILGILIRMSQTHYNKEIRSALRSGNFGHRKKVLQKMDFATILDQRIDDYKYVAFQFAQAITLIDGLEIYSKQSASECFPYLKPFIYRDADHIMNNLTSLNDIAKIFWDKIKNIEFIQQNNLVICTTSEKLDEGSGDWNHLEKQCSGTVIDVLGGDVIAQPLSFAVATEKESTWPTDGERGVTREETHNIFCFFEFQGAEYLTGHNNFQGPEQVASAKEAILALGETGIEQWIHLLRKTEAGKYDVFGKRSKNTRILTLK